MKNRLRRIFALKCGNGNESECPNKREVLKKLSTLFFFKIMKKMSICYLDTKKKGVYKEILGILREWHQSKELEYKKKKFAFVCLREQGVEIVG